jgi:hypothetical protein
MDKGGDTNNDDDNEEEEIEEGNLPRDAAKSGSDKKEEGEDEDNDGESSIFRFFAIRSKSRWSRIVPELSIVISDVFPEAHITVSFFRFAIVHYTEEQQHKAKAHKCDDSECMQSICYLSTTKLCMQDMKKMKIKCKRINNTAR